MGWVYFIEEELTGNVKIGFTEREPRDRLKDMQTTNSSVLELLAWMPGGREDEKALHRRFADDRVNREWFKPTSNLHTFIDACKYWCSFEPVPHRRKPTREETRTELVPGWISEDLRAEYLRDLDAGMPNDVKAKWDERERAHKEATRELFEKLAKGLEEHAHTLRPRRLP